MYRVALAQSQVLSVTQYSNPSECVAAGDYPTQAQIRTFSYSVVPECYQEAALLLGQCETDE